MASRKQRDEGCCGVEFLKNVLHIFNLVFLLAGVAVLGVGVWTVVDKHQYISLFTTVTYALAAYVLIVAGILVLFVTFVGCYGVCKENRCLLLAYTFLLLLIFLLEAMVGILASVYGEQVEHELSLNLNATFLESYNMDPYKTTAIDSMQREYKCCGAIRFEDWEYSRWLKENPDEPNLVPDSCCKTESVHCGKSKHPSNISYNGCVYRLSSEIKDHLVILGAVGLGICVLQIFGMVFACCLYIKLRDVVD